MCYFTIMLWHHKWNFSEEIIMYSELNWAWQDSKFFHCVRIVRKIFLNHCDSSPSSCSVLGCVLALQEVALYQSSNFLSHLLSIPFPVALQCHLLQVTLCLLTDLAPIVYHCLLLMVHLSFIRVMCPDHFHFALVTIQLCLSLWFFA